MPIQQITAGLVNEICQKYPGLAVLNLSDNEISEIENLQPLSSLTRLNLSGNRVVHLHNLSSLGSLVELKAARNSIRTLHLDSLNNLKSLDLSTNDIESIDQIRSLARLPNLEHLTLEQNPICNHTSYALLVFEALPALSTLDQRSASEWRTQQEAQSRNQSRRTCADDHTHLQGGLPGWGQQGRGLKNGSRMNNGLSTSGHAGAKEEKHARDHTGQGDDVGGKGHEEESVRTLLERKQELGERKQEQHDRTANRTDDERESASSHAVLPASSSLHGTSSGEQTCVRTSNELGSRRRAQDRVSQAKIPNTTEHRAAVISAGTQTHGQEDHAKNAAALSKERRRSAALEQRLAEAMGSVALLESNLHQAEEDKSRLKHELRNAEESSEALAAKLRQAETEIASLRAYTATSAHNLDKLSAQREAEEEEEGAVCAMRSQTEGLCKGNGANAHGGGEARSGLGGQVVDARATMEALEERVRLQGVQLSALREILAVQDATLSPQRREEPHEHGSSVSEVAGNTQQQQARLLQVWREQVFELLVRNKVDAFSHQQELDAFKAKMDESAARLWHAKLQLDRSSRVEVDLRAEVEILQQSVRAEQGKVLELERVSEQQAHDLERYTRERKGVMELLQGMSAAMAMPAKDGRRGRGADGGKAAPGPLAVVQQVARAGVRLSSHGHRLQFALRRLGVAKGLLLTRSREMNKELDRARAELASTQKDRTGGARLSEGLTETQGSEEAVGSGLERWCGSEEVCAVRAELERVYRERDVMALRLGRADEDARQLVEESKTVLEAEARRLSAEVDSLRLQLTAALADGGAERGRAEELEEVAAGLESELKARKGQLEDMKDRARVERERAELSAEARERAVRDELEEALGELRGENMELRKDCGKHVVHIRQVERQLAQALERAEKEDRMQVRSLEERLQETQDALRQVRKERNAALATMRQLEREQQLRATTRRRKEEGEWDGAEHKVGAGSEQGAEDGKAVAAEKASGLHPEAATAAEVISEAGEPDARGGTGQEQKTAGSQIQGDAPGTERDGEEAGAGAGRAALEETGTAPRSLQKLSTPSWEVEESQRGVADPPSASPTSSPRVNGRGRAQEGALGGHWGPRSAAVVLDELKSPPRAENSPAASPSPNASALSTDVTPVMRAVPVARTEIGDDGRGGGLSNGGVASNSPRREKLDRLAAAVASLLSD